MPLKRGQSQTTRWYQLCFFPTSSDSSDDSDVESVVLTPSTPTTTSSTWQELSPPSPPPPNPEPQIDWRFPRPPPPPPFSGLWDRPFNIEVLLDRPQPSSQPPPPPNPEPQIDWRFPPPPPPSSLSGLWDRPFNIEVLLDRPQPSSQELSPPPPPPNPEPQIDSRLPPPPPPPPPPQLSGVWDRLFNIEVQLDRPQPPSLSHVFEGDKSGCSTNAMNGLSRVRGSEMDILSLCPICMDEFKVCDQAYRLPCNHTYCSECILRWLDSCKTCPVCRFQLNGYSFDSINDSNDLNSQLDILSLSPSPPSSPIIQNDSPRSSEYLYESSLHLTPVIENSARDNSDEADYDSACDELGDSQEDGASHIASDTLI